MILSSPAPFEQGVIKDTLPGCARARVRVCVRAWMPGRGEAVEEDGTCKSMHDDSIGFGVKEIILMYFMSDKCHRLLLLSFVV